MCLATIAALPTTRACAAVRLSTFKSGIVDRIEAEGRFLSQSATPAGVSQF